MLAKLLARELPLGEWRDNTSASTPASTPFLPEPLPALLPALFWIWSDSDSVPGRQDRNQKFMKPQESDSGYFWNLGAVLRLASAGAAMQNKFFLDILWRTRAGLSDLLGRNYKSNC